ncbi:hydroxyacid dehydrogenase, partial [Candidatus Roizmanbacteria bacterium CG17_big_fil_post_rev_8_21_14_2_50_39_7]
KNLGLTNFRGAKPTKEEVVIAKNYYNKEELAQLNALVEQYLIFATEQARRRVPMTMNDWIKKLHGFLIINDRNILHDAGKISHELMKEIAEKKFDEYKQGEATQDVDFDEVALQALESAKNKLKK